MFRTAIALLLVALLAAMFGFTGIAGIATGFAKIVFLVALAMAMIAFIAGGRGSGSTLPALGLGFVGLCLAGSARADEPPVFVQQELRTGATFGAGVGLGHISCETADGGDCGDGVNPAGGLSLHGGFVMGSVALVGDVWGMGHTEDRQTVSQAIMTGGVRIWVAERLWLQGGLGAARESVHYDGDLVDFESRTDWVPAVMGAIGVELVSAPQLALDLELRGGTGLYDDDVQVNNVSLGVGLDWY